MNFWRRDNKAPEQPEAVPWIAPRDRRAWKTFYPQESRSRQRLEGWLLFIATILAIVFVYRVWAFCANTDLRYLLLAGLGGLLGGLLQDAKFFYKSVGDGNWIWDKSWWRLMTPIASGAMGFSVYLIFRAGEFASANAGPDKKEEYYAYGIGFLTGLFADNALQKLRDIAYTIFGTPKVPPHKLHTVKVPSEGTEHDYGTPDDGSEGQGHNSI